MESEKCPSPMINSQVESPSILDNLKRRKLHIEEQLGKVNAAITALEENPSVSKVLELIARTNY